MVTTNNGSKYNQMKYNLAAPNTSECQVDASHLFIAIVTNPRKGVKPALKVLRVVLT